MMADLLLRQARIVGRPGEPVDVVINAGAVTELRPAGAGPGALAEVDLAGRWLLPGLIDRHIHLLQWAIASHRLDLSTAGSAAEAAQLAAAAVAAGSSEVVGFGFRDGLWADQPTVSALDAVTGDSPVVLVSGDLHCAWVNSAALAKYGLAPVIGLVRETDAFALLRELDALDDATADAWSLEALRVAATRGVTRVTDVEMRWSFEDWPRRAAQGPLPVKVDVGFYPQELPRVLERGLRTGELINRTGGRAWVGPLKIITDGSLNTRTAWCVDPYPGLAGQPDQCGVASVPPEELVPLLRTAAGAGLRAAVHAIGDRANQAALDAFEATGAAGSIEHAQLLRRSDIARFVELGLVASMQPEHAMDDRDVADRYWAGRTDRAFLLRELDAAGVQLALGSDAPVAPLDPWIAISAAVTRSRDGRPAWHPEQRIDLATALAASTDGVGVVRAGIRADLAIVEQDPYALDGDELRAMPVWGTLVDGEWSHRA